MTCESLALISSALQKLDSGQLAVCRYVCTLFLNNCNYVCELIFLLNCVHVCAERKIK